MKVQLKTSLEVVLSELKNMGFPPLCSGKSVLSSETFAFFETNFFSGARNISVQALAVRFELGNVGMVSTILGRCASTPS